MIIFLLHSLLAFALTIPKVIELKPSGGGGGGEEASQALSNVKEI